LSRAGPSLTAPFALLLLGLTAVQFLVVALFNAGGTLSCDAP
jgi:hypothetical protein